MLLGIATFQMLRKEPYEKARERENEYSVEVTDSFPEWIFCDGGEDLSLRSCFLFAENGCCFANATDDVEDLSAFTYGFSCKNKRKRSMLSHYSYAGCHKKNEIDWLILRRSVYKYISTYVYTHTHMHTYKHTYIYADIRTYTHTHTHTYIHTYINTYIHEYIYTYSHVKLTYNYAWSSLAR